MSESIPRFSGPTAVARYDLLLPGGATCPIAVGPGVSSEAPDHAAALRVSRCVVVTDSNLERTHASSLLDLLTARGIPSDLVSFPAGEQNKTRATKEAVEDRMIALGCGRDSAVIAVGGGVTGDLAGFVAATYMRGIPFLQVPTSLIAMADAAIGGKVGVDHPLGKNLVGAFHHPAAVLVDPTFLATLPEREFRSGLAEIVKAGVVADASLFEHLETIAEALSAGGEAAGGAVAGPLARAVAVKVSVVSADPRESDLRKILNFGHTIGHALERWSGWRLSHGEAIAAGMTVEAAISRRLGWIEESAARRIPRLLAALGLPVRLPRGADPAVILEAARTDKKAREGRLEFALPNEIGGMARGDRGYGLHVPDDIALACLEEAGAPS